MLEGLETHNAASIGRLLAAGTLDPVEATEFFLDRIVRERANPAFTLITPERARREATASRRRYREGRPAGPLDGVPVAWKDLIDMAGARTSAGSALFAESPPKERGRSHRRKPRRSRHGCSRQDQSFRICVFGTRTQFVFWQSHQSRRTRRRLAFPGGSSSGSAVAVAAGLAPCAIGSDTGGSIRAPAAFCGIVGYKSTEGRVDTRGVFPLSRTLDTIGPMARSVEDCVLIDMALRGQLTTAVRRTDPGDLELVIPSDAEIDDVDDAVGANFERALTRLSAAGARIVRRPVPSIGKCARSPRVTARWSRWRPTPSIAPFSIPPTPSTWIVES